MVAGTNTLYCIATIKFIENFPNSVFCEWNSIFINRLNTTVIFTVICLYKHVYSRCISVSSVFHFILIRSNQNLTNNVMYVPYSMSTDFFFAKKVKIKFLR